MREQEMNQRTQNTIRVRDVAHGIAYHLVFEGSIANLTVRDLKQHVEAVSQVPVEQQILFIGDDPNPLLDIETGAEMHLRDGSTLSLSTREAERAYGSDGNGGGRGYHTYAVDEEVQQQRSRREGSDNTICTDGFPAATLHTSGLRYPSNTLGSREGGSGPRASVSAPYRPGGSPEMWRGEAAHGRYSASTGTGGDRSTPHRPHPSGVGLDPRRPAPATQISSHSYPSGRLLSDGEDSYVRRSGPDARRSAMNDVPYHRRHGSYGEDRYYPHSAHATAPDAEQPRHSRPSSPSRSQNHHRDHHHSHYWDPHGSGTGHLRHPGSPQQQQQQQRPMPPAPSHYTNFRGEEEVEMRLQSSSVAYPTEGAAPEHISSAMRQRRSRGGLGSAGLNHSSDAVPIDYMDTTPTSSPRHYHHPRPRQFRQNQQQQQQQTFSGAVLQHTRVSMDDVQYPPSTTSARQRMVVATVPTSEYNALAGPSPDVYSRLSAAQLKELMAEREYVWYMEQQRFNTEREARLRVLDESQRELSLAAIQLEREQAEMERRRKVEQQTLAELQRAVAMESVYEESIPSDVRSGYGGTEGRSDVPWGSAHQSYRAPEAFRLTDMSSRVPPNFSSSGMKYCDEEIELNVM